jgi:molecular chaperone DnaJ
MKDPYDLLGLDRSATADDVKAAFRKLAAKHHPDRNPDDPEAAQRFKEINAAYQLLSDPKKRAMFDRFGVGDGGPAGGPPGAGPFGQNPFAQGVPFDFSEVNIDGLFGDLLGALGFKSQMAPPLQKEVRIAFEEAAFGCTKELTYERAEPCNECSGSGAAAGSNPATCATCMGRGRVRMQQGVLPLAIERPCPTCRGQGRIITEACGGCRGAGLVQRPRTIEITIPEGVENGASRIVERGGNYARADRAPGDLELVIRVAPHDIFRRLGDDVVCARTISFPQAALGAELELPTLDGKGKLRIPPGTQPGTVLRIKGKGIPHRVMKGRGDQLVEIVVEVPQALDARQRELLEELERSLGGDRGVTPTGVSEPESPGLLGRFKKLFE